MSAVAQRDGVRMIAFNKCGHTSIINAFKTEPDQLVTRGGGTLSHRDSRTPEVCIAYFRHPLNRLASVYNHLIVEEFREKLGDLGFFDGMEFVEFCEHLLTVDIGKDEHLQLQAASFGEHHSQHAASWLGRLENIEQTWPIIVDEYEMGCAKQLPHFNKKQYTPLWVGDDITAALIELYQRDFHIWETMTVEARASLSPIGNEASNQDIYLGDS